MDNSESSAWARAFQKYSPSTNVLHSPTIMTQGHIRSLTFVDSVANTLSWLINANEEFYYQNAIELLSIGRTDKAKSNIVLRKNRVVEVWPTQLTDFLRLGEGSFGTVYRATDKTTSKKYAVKEVRLNEDNVLQSIFEVIAEKNAHFRANESAFVVQLLGAFQYAQSFWMVFECCIGDLSKYLNYIRVEITTFMDFFLTRKNILSIFYKGFSEKFQLDLEKVGFIYSFELLAGLDYMAKRNLIHRDIKPENILVSSTGHLKIADLGLAQRVRWIDRYTSVEMVYGYQLKDLENTEKNSKFAGNLLYSDPETMIHYNLLIDKSLVYRFIDSPYFPLGISNQCFLSDLYGVSLIIMELLFMGINLINPEIMSVNAARRFNVKSDAFSRTLFPIRCSYDEDVRHNYLEKIISNQTTYENYELMEFLKSAFRPRIIRATYYTKAISQFHYKEVIFSQYIDIGTIEALQLYKNMNITRYNVNCVQIPQVMMNLYMGRNPPITASTMSELVEDSEDDSETENLGEIKMPYFSYTA